jgi:TonB-linked SusC/RagA family outer membrane protein
MYNFYSKILVQPPGCIRKVILVMKLTTFILFITIMQVSAVTLAQKVTIKAKDVQLSTIFQQIRTQTGYDFAYTTKTLESAKPVTINVKNEELADALKQIFDGQPLSYTVQDKFVTVSVKQPTLPDQLKSALSPDKIDVTGRVLDENKKPLPGATILVKGTNNSTLTDANGVFNLKKVQPGAAITISYIGYEKKEIIAAEQLGDIQLSAATSQLDAVQVVAYGTTSRRLTTGDITSVSAKEIEEQPVDNPLLALEGRVPGMLITQSTGVAGSGISIKIQGINSLTRGTDPLIVIDGVPYNSQALPNLAGGLLGDNGNTNVGAQSGSGSPLSFINPYDIESIEVLKDASATSIYGSRAANGAILITTKKGKAGATKVDANVQQGWGRVTGMLRELNTQQYLQMRHEAFKNDGLSPGPNDYDINGTWDTTRYTNWQKVLIGNTAKYTDANVSISGGSANTQFLIGGGFKRQTSVFPGDFADEKGSFHINLNHSSVNQQFKIQADVKYLVDHNQLPATDYTLLATELSPDAPPLYNATGGLNWAPLADGTSSWYNPLANQLNLYDNKTNNLIANTVLSYELMPGLVLKSNFGINHLETNEIQQLPLSANAPDQIPFSQNFGLYQNGSTDSWIIEPQVTYKRTIEKGTLDILVGATAEQNSSKTQGYLGSNYPNDQLLQNPGAASIVHPLGGNVNSIYRYAAFFGRLNYNWQDKYILETSVRRDGSSRFGPANEFHTFGSVAGAWLFSNEDFVKNVIPGLSYGKLRASYGTTGNDQIGDYQFTSVYFPYTYIPNAYQGITSLLPGGLTNPYLQWEETNKLQFGLDLGFFKDRVLINASYYRNRSSNLLQGYTLPFVTGFPYILKNFPATIQNMGLELGLNTVNIKGKDFSWSSGLTMTVPRNKLIAFPNLAASGYATYYTVGQPVNIIHAFNYIGVNPQTGIAQFKDAAGNITATPSFGTDNTVLIDPNPKFYGGFSNSIHYKGLSLEFLLTFTKQIGFSNLFGVAPGIFASGGSAFAQGPNNQPVYVLQRWQNPGDQSLVQKFSTQYSSYNNAFYYNKSKAGLSDASFARLKNLSLSWEVPGDWKKRLHVQNTRLFVQGQNLFTFTNYKGVDPENLTTGSLPPLKMLTLGFQVGF